MREMEIDWDSVLRRAKRKVLLCADRNDRDVWVNALSRAVARDESYVYRTRHSQYELLVVDLALNVEFLVNVYNTNQWSWSERMRGLRYDEVLVTGRGMKRMEYPENLPEALSRRERNNTVSEMSLYLLTQNDKAIAESLGRDIGKTTALDGENFGTMSEEFDFPVSLFRRSMMGYFEDYRRPTREEFLFALTMENISGSTAREKKAIEEALLYVQSKGNNANSSSA